MHRVYVQECQCMPDKKTIDQQAAAKAFAVYWQGQRIRKRREPGVLALVAAGRVRGGASRTVHYV